MISRNFQTPQPVTLANNSTDIPVFNIPEVKTPEPKKNIAKSSITNQIEKGKEIVSAPSITNMTQDLFDSTIDQPEFSVASSSKSADISLPPEIVHLSTINPNQFLRSLNQRMIKLNHLLSNQWKMNLRFLPTYLQIINPNSAIKKSTPNRKHPTWIYTSSGKGKTSQRMGYRPR